MRSWIGIIGVVLAVGEHGAFARQEAVESTPHVLSSDQRSEDEQAMARLRAAFEALQGADSFEGRRQLFEALLDVCADPERAGRLSREDQTLPLLALQQPQDLERFRDIPLFELDDLRARMNRFLGGLADPGLVAYVPGAVHQLAYYVARRALIERLPQVTANAIAEALERYPATTNVRAVLSACLAEAQRRLLRPGDALATLAEFDLDSDRLHITCRALLDLGLADQAAALLANNDPPDLDAEQFVERQLLRADIGLASGRVEALSRKLERVFEDARLLTASSRALAQLRLRTAVVNSELALTDVARAPQALARLEAVLDTPELECEERALAIRAAIFLAMKHADLDAAERWIALHASESRAGLPTEERAFLVACEARIARLRGASPADAERRRSDLEGAWRQALAMWRGMPLRTGGVGFFTYSVRRMILGEMVQQRLAAHPGAEGVEAALDVVMQAGTAGTLARRLGAPECTFEQARDALLKAGRGMLIVVPDDVAVHLFLVDGEHEPEVLSREWLYARESLALDWLDLLERRPASMDPVARAERIERAASAFRSRMLSPAAERRIAGWSEIYLVGADVMGGAPWEAMPFGATVLGAEKAIARLPSLALGIALTERARTATFSDERALAVASRPSPELLGRWQGLVDLPFASDDLERLRAPFKSVKLASWVGDEVTRDALLAIGERHPRLLHFIGHGIRDPRREAGAALVVAGNAETGLIYSEVATHALTARLVILSACQAADSPLRLGDDAVGNLGSAALLGGAESVIFSHGSLDYSAALHAAAVLHARLQQGDAPAHALRASRRHLLMDPNFADPYYHGRWMCLGLGFEPIDR